MINFLSKKFIKNNEDVTNPAVRRSYGFFASSFGLISNLLLFIIKITIGLLSSSISIISDAFNNLSDFGTSFISLFGFKLSKKPADEDHPFGHARIEYICSLLIAFFIIALGAFLVFQSITNIVKTFGVKQDKPNTTMFIITISLLSFAVLVKLLQCFIYFGFGKKIRSVALKGVGIDSRNDVFITIAVIISYIITAISGYSVEGYASLLLSFLIIYSGVQLTIDTSKILLGEKPDTQLIQQFVKLLTSEKAVLGIHDLEMHSYGVSIIHASVHVEVDSETDIMESHDTIDNLERLAYQKLGIKTVIHMDPIKIHDPLTDKYKQAVSLVLNSIDPELTYHDFRIVSGPTHINIVFDIVMTKVLKLSRDDIKNAILKKLKSEEPNLNFYLVISFDEKYTDIVDF